ncbi:hypothetical protein IVB69_11770 [Flavobacterium sp. J49]|uniref:Uncharacterized protein n=1 Tax=Flavobacterium rivulicola TaxID=2732161 RepID=A0A7Y3R8A2_9FLAO|nr:MULTISPECIES: hypothetical protein [unclassified Flavobacterium]MBF6642161.1 hypothetical protein [Flavobacterium sp. J49]NIC03408.1 hypothetical protein [Flavobacterium sp. J49]NNT71681.1 hypothetical protein [Flavobacterium sp. IMCC34852]
MKKILLFSFFIVSSLGMTSCTTDSVAETAPELTTTADDTGGQSGGLLPPPPPKP